MAEPVSRTETYKGHEIIARAIPLGSAGGFNADVFIGREHGDHRTEVKVVGKPNAKAWLHDSAEKALQHAFLVGREWVDGQG